MQTNRFKGYRWLNYVGSFCIKGYKVQSYSNLISLINFHISFFHFLIFHWLIRQWVLQAFSLWKDELEFVERLLDDDIRLVAVGATGFSPPGISQIYGLQQVFRSKWVERIPPPWESPEYAPCPNLMNLSRVLNPPKTGFNWPLA